MELPRTVLLRFAAVAMAAMATACSLPQRDLEPFRNAGAGHDVEVRRDDFGVPHVYGKTDADVAFGLAWAHCEDDFHTMQETLLMTRGRLATLQGRKGAISDYLVALLDARTLVAERYEADIPADVRAVVEAYAQGINAYAANHPGEIRAEFRPVTGQDIVSGFVLTSPMFFGLDKQLAKLFRGEIGPEPAPEPMGSNGFAVAPSRSADGATRLIVNSHQPFTGPVAWYEARLHSDEGWNVEGALFPGSPFVLVGHNADIAWTNTVNRPDLLDIYRLEIDPENPDRYRLDGEWRELEKGEVKIEVKLWGPFSWTVTRETLRSVHGPVLRLDHGTYAFRYAGMGDIRQVVQYFRIDRARDFGEFLAAMRLQAIVSTNFIYADRSGRIAYFYNGRFPERVEGVDWSGILPGDRSDLIWTTYAPFSAVPRIVDPLSGFVFNSNNEPFVATGSGDNLRREDFPATWGIETRMTNRAWRAFELFDADPSISRDEMIAYKFDLAYDERSALATAVREVLAAQADDDLLREAQDALRRWDGTARQQDRWAAIPFLLDRAQIHARIALAPDPDPLVIVREAAAHVKQHFGRLDVPLREMVRLVRGDVDLPLDGGPDTLRAVNGDFDDAGRIVANAGDTFILLVEWDRDRRLTSQAIHQFGAATSHPDSPHYADQAPLFATLRWRPVHFDEADLEGHIERRYRPGVDDGLR